MPKIPVLATNEIRKRILNELMDSFEESAFKEATALAPTTKTTLQSKTVPGLVAERYLEWKTELDNMSDDAITRLFRTKFQTKALRQGVAGMQEKYGEQAPPYRDPFTKRGQVKRVSPPTITLSPLQSMGGTLSHEIGHSKSDLMAKVRSYVLEVTPELSSAVARSWKSVNPINKQASMKIVDSALYGAHPKDPNLAKIVSEAVATGYGWVGAKRAGRKPTSVEEEIWPLLPNELKRRIIETASVVGTTGAAIGATQLGGEGSAEAMPLGPIKAGASKALPELTKGILSEVSERYAGANILGKQVKAVHKGVKPDIRYIEFTDDSFVPISQSEARSMAINLGYKRETERFASEVEPGQMEQAYRSLASRIKAREWVGEGAVEKVKTRMSQIVGEGKGLEIPTSDDIFLYDPKRKQAIPLPRPYYDLLVAKGANLRGFQAVDASGAPIRGAVSPVEGTPKTSADLQSFLEEEFSKRGIKGKPGEVSAMKPTWQPSADSTSSLKEVPVMGPARQTSFLPSSAQPLPFQKQVSQLELPLPRIPRLPSRQLNLSLPFDKTTPRRSGPSIAEQLGLDLQFVSESRKQAFPHRPTEEQVLGYGSGRGLLEEYFGENQ